MKVIKTVLALIFTIIGILLLLIAFSDGLDIVALVISLVFLFLGVRLLYKAIIVFQSEQAKHTAAKSKDMDINASLEDLAEDNILKNVSSPSTVKSTSSFLKYMPPKQIDNYTVFYSYRQHVANLSENIKIDSLYGYPRVSFEFEELNPYDSKAIKLMVGSEFLGYVHRGRTQEMIHSFTKKNDPIYAYIYEPTLNEDNVEYEIHFYKDPITTAQQRGETTTSLVGTKSFFEDGGTVETSEIFNLYYNYDKEQYLVTNQSFEEVGWLNKSISSDLNQRTSDESDIICVVSNVVEKEDGSTKVQVYAYTKRVN